MKTQWCDQCKHFDSDRLAASGKGNPCGAGHRPRFYKPLTLSQDWGWKRQCEDFAEAIEAKLKEKHNA